MENILNLPLQQQSKVKIITYWIITSLLVFELLLGALWDFDLVNKSFVRNVLTHLGYPIYFGVLLGVCKIVAAIVILVPGLPLLKEWAYAGMTFIFAGAVVSHMVMEDGFNTWVWALLYGIVTLISWALRPPSRKIADERLTYHA
jgi:hypothetical protein